ncbi:calcineurin-like phosphoesterase C-terminal domain-containing protein [Belliella kenyensis]|uniref:Calcineurin-like phosphoesterase C-terminal domain-containing protein n=1 Tax=Belliella kenyensis TaxID=1472724 RepID=A0ABV8EM45_9BACT|nr:calcineurin-like phosphoesterase family protein [Belliella kenyensis]MCH7400309.1 calcineurin-like phosphoesterase family protein [Belliella kenyensis]MDN3604673.1 calcineurin-like phosphoesterase family protein [Belliella kenyensis]
MKKINLFLIGLLSSTFLWAQETAKGIVYEDLNGNGKKDRNEKGISDVAISNGRDVVKTDEKGSYSLEVKEGDLIFLIKPSGYAVALNEFNFPQHYYIYKPSGSPKGLKYAGSEPTGKLPKSIDFPIKRQDESSSFTALVFGDPQPYNLTEVDYFYQSVVKEVEGIQGIPFGIALGDIVGDDLSLYPAYSKVISKIGIPWYHVMGNHDQNYDVEEDQLTDETFSKHFGPSTYAFNYADAHIIVLENILYPDPRDGKGYWGGFREDQLKFLENNLKHVSKDKLVIVAMHIPLFEEGDSFRDEDRERLFELLKDYPHTLSMSAHTHYQRQDLMGESYGWKGNRPHHHYNAGTPSGDWYKGQLDENGLPIATMRDGSPRGYAFLEVNGNEYKINYKVPGKPADYQMDIFAPKVIEAGKRNTSDIYVNFFMGTEENEVRFRLNEGKWVKMSYLEDYDPKYMLDLFEWDRSEKLLEGRRPSLPAKSTHLWRASVPNNLPAGIHTIEVEATDLFGTKHKATAKIEAVEK